MSKPNYNTDIYYIRTDINEFLREHPFVSDLYDATLQCLFSLGESKEEALNVFNQAYFLCTLIIEEGGDKHDILRYIDDDEFEKDSDEFVFMGLILTVVKCLLRVHQELVVFDSNILKWLGEVISVRIDSSQFNHVVTNYAGDFDKALNFSGKMVEIPVEEKNECEDPAAMIEKAQSLICEAKEKLLDSSEKKDERIVELEELLRLERDKTNTLMMRVTALENAKDEADSHSMTETDEIYKAINYETISEYACGLSKEEDASVISNMMSKLALRHGVNNADLTQKIFKIDEVQQNKHKPTESRVITCEKYVEREVNNENKDSQVFNGDIDNSQFGK